MSLIALLLFALIGAIAWAAAGRAADRVVRGGLRAVVLLFACGLLATMLVPLQVVLLAWIGTALALALAIAVAGVRRPGAF